MDKNSIPKKPYVLVIEDEEITKIIIQKTLQDLGYNSVVFNSGKEAMKFLKSLDDDDLPWVILSDIMMDEGDGVDVLSYIRGQSSFEYTPFVFLSGANQDLFLNLVEPDSFQGFLQKPVDKNKIRDLFNSLSDEG